MSIAYESPGYDAAERASLNPPEGREPTAREANEIERRLEEMADEEISKGAQPFRDWIAESPHAANIAIAATYWPRVNRSDGTWACRMESREQQVTNFGAAIEHMRADYIAYRVNTFTDDERAEVVREVME